MKIKLETCKVLQMPHYINYDEGTDLYLTTKPYKSEYINDETLVDFLEVKEDDASCIVRGIVSTIDYIPAKEFISEKEENFNSELEEYSVIVLRDVTIEDLENRPFSIDINNISFGWEYIKFNFGVTSIPFQSSYIGEEPLSELITSVSEFEENSNKYSIVLSDEPGFMEIYLNKDDQTNLLNIDIKCNVNELKTWHITIEYKMFKQAIIDTALKILRRYGLRGFNKNWAAGTDIFPLNTLLTIMLGEPINNINQGYYSNIFDELESLKQILKNYGTEETDIYHIS